MKLDTDVLADKAGSKLIGENTERACRKASVYMMKYMDGDISGKEAAKLNGHISSCPKCMADFMMYDLILEEMEEAAELMPPPEGFADRVMKSIAALPSPKAAAAAAMDNIICVVWGAFSLLFGVGFLLVLNKDSILEYLLGVPALSGYLAVVMPMSERLYEAVGGFFALAAEAGMGVIGFITNFKLALLAAAAALIVCLLFASRPKAAGEKS